jgi:hypothetical protein
VRVEQGIPPPPTFSGKGKKFGQAFFSGKGNFFGQAISGKGKKFGQAIFFHKNFPIFGHYVGMWEFFLPQRVLCRECVVYWYFIQNLYTAA